MIKPIAPLLLALAAGCSYRHVGGSPETANPPFFFSESSYDEDGPWNPREPDVHRVRAGRGGLEGADTAEVAARINAAGKPVVMLIHGCNNTYPEARRSYELARLLLPRQDVVFLEVYWDGGAGDPVALWAHAREESKWAGLALRGLLRRLDADVRVITHSRGAALIASALWNLPLREGAPEEVRFRERQGVEAVPDLRRYRLALIAPAMGEEDLDACPRQGLDRLIVGVNEDDPAVGKGFLPASWFGSTRLGAEREPFYTHAVPAARRASLVDFSGSLVHDFKDYLLRRAFREAVLPRLLDGYQDRSMPAVSKAP